MCRVKCAGARILLVSLLLSCNTGEAGDISGVWPRAERGPTDLRYCLELKSNYAIARCAEPPSVIINSMSGNGFGVVAKVVGKIDIGERAVQIHPDAIELRSFGSCDPDCPSIRSVALSLTKESGNSFSTVTQGEPIPVNQILPNIRNLAVSIPASHSSIELDFRDRKQLAGFRLTLEINGELKDQGQVVQASWYAHSELMAPALDSKTASPQLADEAGQRQAQAQDAVLNGRVADLKRLLQAGVDANARDTEGKTMLMRAADRGDLAGVKLLLAHGAQVNAKTAVDREGNGAYTALHAAMKQDAVRVVDALVKAGADTHAEANQVWTPMHFAAYHGAVRSIRYLHRHNINIDKPFSGAGKSTPLMIAAQYEQISAIQALLKLGADPKRRDSIGEDACGYARHFGKPASIKALDCK